MSVKDPSEVRNMNRKTRNKMSVVKDGLEVSELIIQEGVHTHERVPVGERSTEKLADGVAGSIESGTAEPVVYMIDRYVIGGFYRVNTTRANDENLNAPGAQFVPLPFASSCNFPDPGQRPAGGAEPLLRIRRRRAPRAAGRVARARAHRPGRRSALTGAAARRSPTPAPSTCISPSSPTRWRRSGSTRTRPTR